LCGSSEKIIKAGVRVTQKGDVQKLLCRNCGRYFSASVHPYSRYPDKMIIKGLILYNQGVDLPSISRRLDNEFNIKAPTRTIYSWLERYQKRYGLYLLKGLRGNDGKGKIKGRDLNIDPSIKFRYHPKKIKELLAGSTHFVSYIRSCEEEDIEKTLARLQRDCKDIDCSSMLFREEGHGNDNLDELYSKYIEYGGEISFKEFNLLNNSNCIAKDLPVYLEENESIIKEWFGKVDLVMANDNRVSLLIIADEDIALVDHLPFAAHVRESFSVRSQMNEDDIDVVLVKNGRYFNVLEN
jgi:transposase-like protein